MLLTYKIHLMQRLQQACAIFLLDNVTNHQMLVPQSCLPPFAPPSNMYKLPQKNENDYSELYISILMHLFPINLNINCYYDYWNDQITHLITE
jgi:hypothetical protein